MSLLTGINVLIVQAENPAIANIDELLTAHGMNVHTLNCEAVTGEKIEALGVDLILLDYVQESEASTNIFTVLRGGSLTRTLPVFAIVTDAEDKIQEALMLGAADYITPAESDDSIVNKIKTIFGQGDNFIGDSIIDISSAPTAVSSTGIRVFVVEDDPLLRNLLSIRLEKSSFPHEFSSDGKDIVAQMLQFKPQVIILDLMLPGKSGFDIFDEIKANSTLAQVPVVIFSNRDGQDDRKKATELGAAGFYVKAMTDLSELVLTIETLAK